jgi:hypothetical protein
MRLALLGPAEGHTTELSAAARFLLDEKLVDRAVYLGIDGALDAVVQSWAESLVGEDPSEEAVWERAARACLRSGAADIDGFISKERARARLRVFESLPDSETRVVEMLGGALAVMIHDKAKLNEEDMLPARILIFGKGKGAVIKQVGQRWFLSAGSLGDEGSGVMLLDDTDEGIHLTLLDRACQEVRTERLSTERGAKLKVSGASA